MVRSFAQPAKELHRVQRVFQADQSALMDRSDEQSRRNSDAVGHMMVLVSCAIVGDAAALVNDHDQPGRIGQMRSCCSGSDRLQRRKPVVPRPAGIEGAFSCSAPSRMCVCMAGSEIATQCQGWWFGPKGPVPAAAMQVVITALGTGRWEQSRTEWRLRM